MEPNDSPRPKPETAKGQPDQNADVLSYLGLPTNFYQSPEFMAPPDRPYLPGTGEPVKQVGPLVQPGPDVREPVVPIKPVKPVKPVTPEEKVPERIPIVRPAQTGQTGQTDFPGLPADRPQTPAPKKDAVLPYNQRQDKSIAPNDQAEGTVVNGVLVLRYGAKDFDQKLAQTNYHSLKIVGVPPTVPVAPWVDGKGFFFYFQKGADGEAQHYMPKGLKWIEINGVQASADEMRVKASHELQVRSNKDDKGFANYKDTTHPYLYAKRMSGIAGDVLSTQEKFLREGAQNSPENPYFKIYLSDILMAQAVQPVIAAVTAKEKGEKYDEKLLSFNNPATLAKIDEALKLLDEAQKAAKTGGDLVKPNTTRMQELSPFALNPYAYNPDIYWGGALYQSWQRQVMLQLMKGWITSNQLRFELP